MKRNSSLGERVTRLQAAFSRVLLPVAAALSAAVLMSLPGCTKSEYVGSRGETAETELSFEALSRRTAMTGAPTKGYVVFPGTGFIDNSTGSPRAITLSAWNSTEERDYVTGAEFTEKGDGHWHATPALYYPLRCGVDLLAYSAGDSIHAEWNTARQVTLQVENTQDDILYSSTSASSMEPTASMTFHHSQAWIEFNLKASTAGVVKVDSIWWEDIYDRGVLRLEFNSADALEPKAEWDFFTQDKGDVCVDGITGITLGTSFSTYDMLLPEQDHGSFVIAYTLKADGEPSRFYKRVDASSSRWERSSKYTYEITFRLSTMSLKPTADVWVEETIDRMNSIDLIEGVFTVNASKGKVLFSKGNLQYRPSDSTWRFAEHQWDCVGDGGATAGSVKSSSNVPVNPGTVTPMTDSQRRLYTGWIDLYGWGATGFRNKYGTNHYGPWETATSGTYGPSASGETSEWGENIRVYEYEGAKSFRTLTPDEWAYILGTARCTGEGFKHSWMLGTLKYGTGAGEKTRGMFLFPDNFIWKSSFGPVPSAYEGSSGYMGYTVDNTVGGRWDALEYAGVVFLPATGQRTGTTYTAGAFNYWTTTSGTALTGAATGSETLSTGCAVRLVTDWK